MSSGDLLYAETTELIIKGFYHVYNTLGYGFLEKIYEKSLAMTLRKWGLKIREQMPIKVKFEGVVVGEYFADLMVSELVIVEVKSAEAINPAHDAQLLNYLKATDAEVGLLLNFGPKAAFRRRVFTNQRKTREDAPAIDLVDQRDL